MKKIFFYASLAIIVYLLYVVITLALMPPVSDLADKKFSTTIQVRDWQGDYHPFVVGPKNRYWTPSGADSVRDEVGGDSGRGRQFLQARGF